MNFNSTEGIFTIIIIIAVVFQFIRTFIRYGYRKNPSMQRKILDVLTQYNCVEQPPFTHHTASAREIAHSLYQHDEYMKNPNHYDLLTAAYLLDMEKWGDVANSGDKVRTPEEAMKKGRWYIKWNPPHPD